MGIQPDKRDLGPAQLQQAPTDRSGVAGALSAAAVLGAAIGAGAALLFAPDLIIGSAVAGAMTLAAIRVGILMASGFREDQDGASQ